MINGNYLTIYEFNFACYSLRFDCEDCLDVTELREKWFSIIKNVTDTPPNFLDEIHNRLSQFENIKVAEVSKLKYPSCNKCLVNLFSNILFQ